MEKHEQNPIKTGGKMFLLPLRSGRDYSINGPASLSLFQSLSLPHQHSYSTLPPSELWMEGPLVFLPLAGPVSTQCTLLYMHTSHLYTAQNGMERGGIRSDRWDAAWVYSQLRPKDWSWTNLEQVDHQLCLTGVYLLQWCLVGDSGSHSWH